MKDTDIWVHSIDVMAGMKIYSFLRQSQGGKMAVLKKKSHPLNLPQPPPPCPNTLLKKKKPKCVTLVLIKSLTSAFSRWAVGWNLAVLGVLSDLYTRGLRGMCEPFVCHSRPVLGRVV